MTGKCGLCRAETDNLYPGKFRDVDIMMCKECSDAIKRDTILQVRKYTTEGKKYTGESKEATILSKMIQLERDAAMKRRIRMIAEKKKIHANRQTVKQVHTKTMTKPTNQQKFEW